MDAERATKHISLVLVSSVLVFAGWYCGDRLRANADKRDGAAGHGFAGGQHGHGSGGSHFFWWHSGTYGGVRPGGVRPGGGTSGNSSSNISSSARGGFGSSGHAAGE